MDSITERKLNVQADFPILQSTVHGKKLVYLDNSATSQKPSAVIRAMVKYYEQDNANVHRAIHYLSQRATLAYEQAHEIVAKFIGADREEIIFTKGTTESLNLLAYSLSKTLQLGDEIILSQMEHHSNLVPWQQVAKEKSLVLKFIPLASDYRLNMKAAQKLITPKTKIVSIVQMSNVLGTINDVKELARIAHQAGAVMIVDAAQSIAHIKVNVLELDCDFLAFSGHKMCGPTGIGVLYGKKERLLNLNPFLYGGDMIREVTFEHSTWNELPWKFEAGTPNIAAAVGLAAAIEYLQELGMEHITRQEQELTRYALQKLSALPKINIIGPQNFTDRGPVISFAIDNLHPHDLSEFLDQEGIAVRGGHHCTMPLMSVLQLPGTTRASFCFYNTKDDVDALCQRLQKALEQVSAVKNVDAIDKNEIISGPLTEEQELYKENILDHYKTPHNKKILLHYTVSHKEFNPICGDVLTLYIHLERRNIKDVSFTGQGCAISQAAASLLTDEIKGKAVQDVKKMTSDDLLQLLGIPISIVRLKCALLSLKTMQNALMEVS